MKQQILSYKLFNIQLEARAAHLLMYVYSNFELGMGTKNCILFKSYLGSFFTRRLYRYIRCSETSFCIFGASFLEHIFKW